MWSRMASCCFFVQQQAAAARHVPPKESVDSKIMKKNPLIIAAIAVSAAVVLASALFISCAVFRWLFPRGYSVGKDEIALYITLDTEEDVGLIVLDCSFDGREYSGGVSNADRSLIKRDEVIIYTWDRNHPEYEFSSDTVDFTVRFRIITEYVDPSFENVYPEEITKYVEPVSWKASFGTAYTVVITGDRTSGYKAAVQAPKGP